jgi:hypothetical protein
MSVENEFAKTITLGENLWSISLCSKNGRQHHLHLHHFPLLPLCAWVQSTCPVSKPTIPQEYLRIDKRIYDHHADKEETKDDTQMAEQHFPFLASVFCSSNRTSYNTKDLKNVRLALV